MHIEYIKILSKRNRTVSIQLSLPSKLSENMRGGGFLVSMQKEGLSVSKKIYFVAGKKKKIGL